MSHLHHRTIYKIPPQGPIFIDGSIMTNVCYSILNCMQRLCDWVKGRSISVSYIYIYIYIYIYMTPWLAESVIKKTCEKM